MSRGRPLPAPVRRVGWRGRAPAAAAICLIAVVTAFTFWSVRSHALLNWDDPDVLIDNTSLQQPAGALVRWAWTTRHMGHYQPLSWLVLAACSGDRAPAATCVHTIALATHVMNAVLLCWLIAVLIDRGDRDPVRWWAALAAAAVFAVHPLRVEPVAWASAIPYLLSSAPLLGSLLCWVTWARTGQDRARWSSVGLFAVSQLARVTAPLLPLALFAITPAIPGAIARRQPALLRAVAPFAVLVAPLTVLEASARQAESLADIGLGPRLAWTLTHPAQYLWRTIVPGTLNPLDPLPRLAVPDWPMAGWAVLGTVALVAITLRLWSRETGIAVWGTYALLLAPVIGLMPSGLQVTADRYTYLPAMVLSAALAALLVTSRRPWPFIAALVVAGAAAGVYAQSARLQLPYWRDSVSLWSRAVAMDRDNDVALYNLALAEIETGRADLAVEHLTRLVALVPDHAVGRSRLDALVADRDLRAAESSAAAGRFEEAITAFDRVLARDPGRTRARRGRGMAALQSGDLARAVADLEAAVRDGEDDPAVVGGLAYALAATGRGAEAVPLLTRAVERHADDVAMASNLARLLVTVEPASLRDPNRALQLAARANDATGGRDPRILDTLALALAATGRRRDAVNALDAAIAFARDAGDRALAEELTRRRSALR
jgi:tetratricopeptide (TPR) repeat protein